MEDVKGSRNDAPSARGSSPARDATPAGAPGRTGIRRTGLLYLGIADYLRNKIYSKQWSANQRIPSENELCEEFGTSRGTVRKAIGVLVNEGLLEQVRGRGTFVHEQQIAHTGGNRPLSFAESLAMHGVDFETEVIESAHHRAEGPVAERLKVAPGDPVLRLVRRRKVAGKPVMLLESWVPLNVCPGIDELPLESVSLFDAVEQTSGRHIERSEMTYSARVAGKERGDLLGIDEASPVLSLEQLISLEDGTPIEWADTFLCTGQAIASVGIQHRGSGRTGGPASGQEGRTASAGAAPERSHA